MKRSREWGAWIGWGTVFWELGVLILTLITKKFGAGRFVLFDLDNFWLCFLLPLDLVLLSSPLNKQALKGFNVDNIDLLSRVASLHELLASFLRPSSGDGGKWLPKCF